MKTETKTKTPHDELLTRKDQLPFDEEQQKAILGWLTSFRNDASFKPHYETFFLAAKDVLKPEWFFHPYLQKLWTFRKEFYNLHKRSPISLEEFKSHSSFTVLEQAERSRLYGELSLCSISASRRELDEVVLERMEYWIQAQVFLEHMAKGVDLYNQHYVIETFDEMKRMYLDLQRVKFNSADVFRVADFQHNAKFALQNLQQALTLGNPTLDQCLLPESQVGCLLPGDTTILLAPTNMGKTTFLINVLVENLLKEKHILFLTHEGRPEDITQKIWMRLLGFTRAEYLNRANDPAWVPLLKGFANYVEKYLVYVPMNKAGLTVEEVEVTVRRKQEERKSICGRYFDLIVDDYPDKLSTKLAEHGQFNKRQVSDHVYSYFVALALEYQSHSLLAFQSNREGAKINRGTAKENRLLFMEDASEAYGPMMTATNVLTLNRPPLAISKGLIILNICKSRSSETGIAVVVRSDYSRAITHKSDSQCTWFRNYGRMPDRIEDLLQQYATREIPLTEIITSAMKEAATSKE